MVTIAVIAADGVRRARRLHANYLRSICGIAIVAESALTIV